MAQRFSFDEDHAIPEFGFDDDQLIPFVGLDESQGFDFDMTDFLGLLSPQPSPKADAEWGHDQDPFVEEVNPAQATDEARKEEETKQDQELPKKKRNYYPNSRKASKVMIEGKLVTFGALVHRDFRYSDTNEEVPSSEKSKIKIENEKAYIGDRQLTWNTKRKNPPNSVRPAEIMIIDGEEIQRYILQTQLSFEDNNESSAELHKWSN